MTVAQTGYSDFLPVGYRLDQFRIDGLLGQGGFSKVYRATDTALHRTVAIKEYLPTQIAVRDSTTVHPRTENQEATYQWGLRRFLAEARLIAQMDHPNVVRILKVFEANNTAYFAMPFERGMDLKAFLQKRGNLTEAELLYIILPLLDALDKLHRRGIFHRDIKPQNIIIRRGMTPLLIDFGAARTVFGQHTHSIPIMSPGYSPIEHHSNDVAAGPYTDLYAFAATCYFAISGRKPVDALIRTAASGQQKNDPLTPARELGQGRYSPALLAALDWGLAVMPEDRPQSVARWLTRFPEQRVLRLDPEAELVLDQSLQDPEPAPSPTPAASAPARPAADAPKGRPRRAALNPVALLNRRPRHRELTPGNLLERLEPHHWGVALAVLLGLALALLLLPGDSDERTETPFRSRADMNDSPSETVPPPSGSASSDTSSVTTPSPPTTRIQALLARAEALMNTRRLVLPEDNNAAALYREVLREEPDNAAARAGLERIASVHLEWARNRYDSRQLERSLRLVDQGLLAQPDHAGLLALRARLEREIDTR